MFFLKKNLPRVWGRLMLIAGVVVDSDNLEIKHRKLAVFINIIAVCEVALGKVERLAINKLNNRERLSLEEFITLIVGAVVERLHLWICFEELLSIHNWEVPERAHRNERVLAVDLSGNIRNVPVFRLTVDSFYLSGFGVYLISEHDLVALEEVYSLS